MFADVTPVPDMVIRRAPLTTEPEPVMLPPESVTVDGLVWSTCAGMGMVTTTLVMSTTMAIPEGADVSITMVTVSPERSGSGLVVVVMVETTVCGAAPPTVQVSVYGVVLVAASAVCVRTTATAPRVRPTAVPTAIIRRARARPGRLIMQDSPLATTLRWAALSTCESCWWRDS
jgi:hypothetical protein